MGACTGAVTVHLLLVHLQIGICAGKMPRLHYKEYSLNEALS